jgi:hypothetical protein
MRSSRVKPIRNTLDLHDRVQVRIIRKRLEVNDEQLAGLVRKAGNSISAIRKENGVTIRSQGTKAPVKTLKHEAVARR